MHMPIEFSNLNLIKPMKRWSLLIVLSLFLTSLSAQLTPDLAAKLAPQGQIEESSTTIDPTDCIVWGVGKKLAGNEFTYSFPVKGIRNSLLIRATDGTQSMEWLSDPLPKLPNSAQFATYIIPVAIGTNGLLFNMSVEIDGEKTFTIDNKDLAKWNKEDKKGRTLTFESNFVDGNRDRRGFFYLRIPKAQLPKEGKPLHFKITADKRGSQSWFMVYTDRLVPNTEVKLSPAIKDGKQQLMVEVTHLGSPVETTVKADGKIVGKSIVKMGNNSFSVSIDKVSKPRISTIEVIANNRIQKSKIQLKPSRKWEVYFVQHTHTDIGYTRPQNEILAEHIRYIDYALDYCDLTDNLPKEAQFRWTCETTWAVEQFLQTRPKEQIERLKKRVAEGRIEVAGMIFNFSELPDEQSLAASLEPLKECRKAGIPVEVAMQNDINGMAWAFADYYPQLGVRYLDMGTHGHRALICFPYPTVFRWQSPSGSEMIAYRAEHYNTGNFFGIEKDDFPLFEEKLLTYLMELEGKGYPYEIAAAQFSGYFTDNSPPSMAACRNIMKWNEKYTFPKIRLAVSTEFIKRIEKEHYASLPVLKQAWPDWWTDGFGAGARETAVGRYTKTDLIANQGLLSMAAMKGATLPTSAFAQIDQVNRANLFFDEHTTGYSESVRQPWCRPTMDQRALKESYAWEAYRTSRTLSETAGGLLQSYVNKTATPSIVVYNTLNYPRTSIAHAYIDHEILPINKEFELIDLATGKSVSAQPTESRTDGTYWQFRVEDVPAFGYKQLAIKVKDQAKSNDNVQSDFNEEVENRFYKIKFDKKKGTISSLYDKELQQELIHSHDGRELGEFVYEQLAERGSMEAFRMGKHSRQGLDTVWVANYEKGDIYDSYNFAAKTIAGIESPAANFKVEYRVHHQEKLIEMRYSIIKKSVVEPEGIYIAMPFELPDAKIYCEVPGGVMQAGVDQIKGSSNDWNTHQNFVSIKNNQSQIILGSTEAPLMQFGGINTGRYKAGAVPESNNIYSWVMNNYWVTNFNAEQRGEYVWSYFITSAGNNSNATATKFGWNQRVALPTRVLPADHQAKSVSIPQKGLFAIEGGEFLLVNSKPIAGEKALLLHIREIAGKNSTISIPGFQTVECNALGEEISNQSSMNIKANGVKFIKLKY